MSSHVHPRGTPEPDARVAFLIDGCVRCEEYVEDLGIHFDADRYRAFWRKMVEVEYDDVGGYESRLDKQLGRRLYVVSLSLQRAFGLDPRKIAAVETALGGHSGGRAATKRELDPSGVLGRIECIVDRLRNPGDFDIDPDDEEALMVEVEHELDALLMDVRGVLDGSASSQIALTPDERARFAAYLRHEADIEADLVEFLTALPAGSNGSRIRTDCKIRRDVKRALADEIERGAVA